MRLDLFLKKTCIVRQRSLAKTICDAGAVHMNGHPAKASQAVQAGDRVRLHLAHRDLEFRVLDLPHGNVAKRDAPRFVEILSDTPRDAVGDVFDGGPAAPD